MIDSWGSRQCEMPPGPFIRQVKQALDHLYDVEYLETHPLLVETGFTDDPSAVIAGQHLRWEISAAIESLNPGGSAPASAPPARVYNLLKLRYTERRTVQKAAQELGLSERQAHRDLRRGEENVAAVLWAHRSTFLSHGPDAIQISSFEAEMARLQPHPRPVDVRELLERVLAAVELQALQRDVQLHILLPAEPVTISVDPVMAEQVLMNTLSYAVEQAYPGSFHVALRVGDDGALLTLRYFLESGVAGAPVVNLVMAQLADRLGWAVAQEDEPEGPRFVTLHIRARGPVILVIDDNEELVDLLELYLTAEACRMTAASDGVEGLRLAQEVIPDAIILDVMMPGMSGWEVLQRVRRHPKTADIPVIMCSVINNPRLAYCLGASLFLPKPVSRTQVVRALRQVGVL